MKTHLFQSCGHCWVSQICWHIECSTFTASSFRIWNSSTGIPSPPLALFCSSISSSMWVTTLLCLSGSLRLFCIVLLCIFSNLSWSLLFLLGHYLYCPLLCPFLHETFPWFCLLSYIYSYIFILGLPGGSDSKESAAMWETRVQFLHQEDSLDKDMENHCSILAWRIPWTEETAGLQSKESQSQTGLIE